MIRGSILVPSALCLLLYRNTVAFTHHPACSPASALPTAALARQSSKRAKQVTPEPGHPGARRQLSAPAPSPAEDEFRRAGVDAGRGCAEALLRHPDHVAAMARASDIAMLGDQRIEGRMEKGLRVSAARQ